MDNRSDRVNSQSTTPAPGGAVPDSGGNAYAGILWMLLTMSLFVGLDAVAKLLSQSYPVLQVTWARFFFHALWLVVLLRRRFTRILRSRRLGLQLIRGTLMLCANGLFFSAISLMNLVDASAIMMTSPLIVTALSVPLLGEQVGYRRWACVAAGCVGAFIIIRPGGGVMQWAALFSLGAALSYSLYQITTRQLRDADPPLTTLFYTVSVGVPVTCLIVPFVWVMPDAQGWALMAAMGLIGGAAHYTLIKAFSLAPVATLSPFNYSAMVWAALFGFLVFSEVPDALTVLGAVIIAASGLYAFFREQRSGRA